MSQRAGRGELGVVTASARCRVSVCDAVELPELPEEPDGDGDLAAAVVRSPLASGAVSSGVQGHVLETIPLTCRAAAAMGAPMDCRSARDLAWRLVSASAVRERAGARAMASRVVKPPGRAMALARNL